jgi:hypothetical protein
MALTTLELAESWQHIITAEGNEEFTLKFYATWDDAFGPRGPNFRFAELGDSLVTDNGIVDERLRLSRVLVSPTMDDREGCLYEQIYTSNNNTLQSKRANLRSSWRTSFSTTIEAVETDKQINNDADAMPGDFTGSAVTTEDTNYEIVKKIVYVPRTVYNVTIFVDKVDVSLFQQSMGKVNKDSFFNLHSKINSGDVLIRQARSKWTFINRPIPAADKHQWLFSNFEAIQIGIDNYELSLEFRFEQAGWNGPLDSSGTPTGDVFYNEISFQPLFAFANVEVRPDSSLGGRT